MNRKGIFQLTAMLFFTICCSLQASAQQTRPNLRMGVLSDIHVCDDESEESFRHALEYFRDSEVDGVIIAGDMADHGLAYELLRVSRAWYSVFPKDMRPDGAHVEKVFVYGNHDAFDNTHRDWYKALPKEQLKLGPVFENYGGNWKKYFKEDFSQIYMKEVKGYKFVCCHWSFENHRQECGAPEFVKAHAAELQGEKPFFYIQHAHLAHTCNGDWTWGEDDGAMTETLKAFPNAIAFSGHSHDPLTDGRDLWQGEFTSIGTASLRYVLPIGGRENSSMDGESRDIPSQMPEIAGHYCHHGMVMSVYDDRITFERREFYYDESLGDDWVMPLPKGADAPLSFESMAKTAPIPQFAGSAAVTLSPFYMGKDRYGKATEQVEVSFPAVLSKDTGVRAFDYEVQIEQRYVDLTTVVGTKHVYSAHCYYGESHDQDDVKCVFAKEELPRMHEYRFVVRPCECYGGKGEPICSDWQKPLDSFNTSPAVAKNYHFTTAGMPDQAFVRIFGNEYPGGDSVGGCPQYDTHFEAVTITAEDVLVTAGDGYVYFVNIDNDNCEVSIEFKPCFLPTPSAEVGVQYEYLMKTSQEYLMVSPDGIELSQKKKDADRIIFIEDFENPDRYYIFDLDARCYITYSEPFDGSSLVATERGKYLRELASPVNTWRIFLLEDGKSVAIVPSSWGSASENSPAWAIKPYTTGSLACATTLFSLPGNEFIHKIVPEEGMEVVDVDLGSLTTLNLYEDRLTVGNRYRYVKGSAPAEEGIYTYTVKVKDADGSIENVPVKLTVSNYLQSPTPAMGWLSWNWFERSISHKKICKIVKGMEERGLVDAGYNTIILDDTWATKQRDQAKLTYDPAKFPKGISGLVKDCKSINPAMRLGIYSDAGLMTCADYQPGSYGYENQHIDLFDSWGIDLLKYDFCNSQASAYDSYAAMGKVITALNERRKSEGRNPFVYYLCEWGHFYPYLWAPEVGGSMWRASGDSRESWVGHHNRLGVLAIVDEARHSWMWAGVNRFNDLDMTLIGLHGLGCPSNNSAEHLENGGVIPGLTDEQSRTNMALWCMLASPIFHSCDFRMKPRAEGNTTAGVLPSPLLTEEDIATVSNKYLISIDQDPLGQQAEYFEHLSTGSTDYTSKGYDVYVKDLAGGRIAVSVTNRASAAQESVTLPLKELYLDGTAGYQLLDVWTGSTSEIRGSLITGPIDPYQTKVYIISK